ncbi:putative bifunctional diguanylate cyclase/phosphodiesterase [Amphibiibacter pelophylacis]|uniref:EAL domain-containing protein n=1 Tax=Amphibiibacter pelophylacis TaxID=1799477 RepID=A0ACC6P550_9BURK
MAAWTLFRRFAPKALSAPGTPGLPAWPGLQRASIRRKLWLLSVLTVSLTALISMVLVIALTWTQRLQEAREGYQLKGRIVADNVVPAVVFNDPQTASEILRTFVNDPTVLRAALILPGGQGFAQYSRSPVQTTGADLSPGDSQTLRIPVMQSQTVVATLLLDYDRAALYRGLWISIGALALATLLSLAVSLYAARRLHRMIQDPLHDLSAVMKRISQGGDYSMRAPTDVAPEITEMSRSFNLMIEQIEQRRQALEAELAERKRMERQLEHLALHDTLTQLPNRNNLFIRLDQLIATARRSHTQVAVFFIDLDRFKQINDTLGHNVGDVVLRETAARLLALTRASDVLARIGGDEFVIAMPDASLASAALVAGKIIDCLSQDMVHDGKALTVTPSIGISLFPDDSASIVDLLKHADMAMYHAKTSGRNGFRFFSADLRDSMVRKVDIEMHLRDAIRNRELFMVYQPKFDFAGNRLASFEALIRWRHPTQGLIPPGDFIPVAEETGLIVEIGEWVLHEVARQSHLWERDFGLKVPVAVNVSSRQLRDGRLEEIMASAIESTQASRDCLELEITESAFMEDPEGIAPALKRLQEQGTKISIDDFGTGYSSLSYLKKLPLNYLKLDQTFVRDIERDPNDAAICHATISLAHSLGLEVIAEGIETPSQFEYLSRLGCDIGQGYYYSRPVEAHECSQWLDTRAGQERDDAELARRTLAGDRA